MALREFLSMMQQNAIISCNLSGANFLVPPLVRSGPGKQWLEAYKFCIIIHLFSSALQKGAAVNAEWLDNTRGITDDCMYTPTPPFFLYLIPSSSVCLPLQPHTPKSCFCTVWRKPTTSSHCSSLTQGCPLCPTAQRSKFRCAFARRTRCTAAPLTPTAPALLCCSPHSCLPYSVSTKMLYPQVSLLK